MQILIIFLDGVGIGVDDPAINPFVHTRTSAFRHPDTQIVPLDAMLGVAGLPQSGTGQTALFTGINAPKKFGRHFGPWVPTQLRSVITEHNILSQARNVGLRVAFANAYPEEIFEQTNDRRLNAGPPLAARAAGILNRHTQHLHDGDAVASEILNEGWRTHLNRTDLPVITATDAGRNLARIANAHDLTLFAHYSTDYVGHRNDMDEAVAAIERVGEFIDAVRAHNDPEILTMVVSDHGNIEDVRSGHTRNPALGLFFGNDYRKAAAGLQRLTDIAPRVRELLKISIP